MKRPNLKYVKEYEDRHGRLRRYFRREGYPSVVLPGPLGSIEFRAAYEAALANKPVITGPTSRAVAGTVNALVLSYLNSIEFRQNKDSTQKVQRRLAENFREKNGDIKVAAIEPRHIKQLMAKKMDTPEAANSLLKTIRALMKHAVETGMRQDNPAIHVRKIRVRTEGFHTWTEEEIAQFEAFHAVGTKARLAFDLLLYTGQRRSDVVKLGRQHMRAGKIDLVQEKTGRKLSLPVHPKLQDSIDAMPSKNMTFLVTEFGKPFTSNGFGNWFGSRCREAGLPLGCVAHGLRKAMARRLAEGGGTVNQIASVTGHTTLKEVERYTREADQIALAEKALRAIK